MKKYVEPELEVVKYLSEETLLNSGEQQTEPATDNQWLPGFFD